MSCPCVIICLKIKTYLWKSCFFFFTVTVSIMRWIIYRFWFGFLSILISTTINHFFIMLEWEWTEKCWIHDLGQFIYYKPVKNTDPKKCIYFKIHCSIEQAVNDYAICFYELLLKIANRLIPKMGYSAMNNIGSTRWKDIASENKKYIQTNKTALIPGLIVCVINYIRGHIAYTYGNDSFSQMFVLNQNLFHKSRKTRKITAKKHFSYYFFYCTYLYITHFLKA